MRRILLFAMLMSFFFVGFLVMNFFVFYGISYFFSWPRTSFFYSLLLIAAISFPTASLLEREFSNLLTRILYAISATWVGISFYILFSFVIYEIITIFIKIPIIIAGIAIIVVAFVVSAYGVINATRLEVKEVDVYLNGLKNDIRAVQLTDVHIGPIRNLGFIERMVHKTNDLNPDIVFITGDLFDGTSMLHMGILNALNNLNAPALYVTGNHDSYQGLEEVFGSLSSTKVKPLRNEVFTFQGVEIVGVDYSLQNRYLKNVLQGIEFDKAKPTILMYHLPREFEAAKQAGIDLQLSGHTHDGQMFPFKFLVKLMFPYISGLYEHQGAYLYVSQGTGTWGPPMRLGSRNEITLINLKQK